MAITVATQAAAAAPVAMILRARFTQVPPAHRELLRAARQVVLTAAGPDGRAAEFKHKFGSLARTKWLIHCQMA
ncbi:hypothetical protein GCM10022285_60450 [Streptomyces tunisiensis]|uniref:Uncharacterized protein n=1 Tax=Streptomyces tunisiensis TaxID=948699 RepID=A0ABP7Z981_9ACTN